MIPASSPSGSDRPSPAIVAVPECYPSPAHSSRTTLRTNIWKLCFECNGYYQAQLDGEYRCPSCRREGRQHERAMTPLDASLEVMPQVAAGSVLRLPVQRVYAELHPRRAAGGA